MNKIIKTLCLCVSVFLFTQTAIAQKLTTESTTIDVGDVLFQSPVSATFEVRNKSSKAANISSIETSCGCVTTSPFEQGIIEPKTTAKLELTYDAMTLGRFEKQVWINYEGMKKPLELTIRGHVVTEIIDFAGKYPCQVGDILTDRQDIEFEDVNRGQRPSEEIHIFNNTKKTMEPVVMHLPKYLSAEVSPSKLLPGHAGKIIVTLLSDKITDNGLTQTSIYLGSFPGDKVSSKKEITSSVVLLPSFDGMTSSQDKAEIQVSDTVIYLSQLENNPNQIDKVISKLTKKPLKLKKDIVIQNTGKAILNISSLQMFTSGLSLKLPKTNIQPGEYVKLHVTINKSVLKAQHTRPRILMITNDPSQPKVVISINP